MTKKYIHVDNGGIEVSLEKDEEYDDFSLSFSVSYYGYPCMKSYLSAMNFEQLCEISNFLNNEIAKHKLKSD